MILVAFLLGVCSFFFNSMRSERSCKNARYRKQLDDASDCKNSALPDRALRGETCRFISERQEKEYLCAAGVLELNKM